ncbi:MAG: xanthine dehydrogenase family protein molybdopterin-binding subunit [Spirochaetia bacterium]
MGYTSSVRDIINSHSSFLDDLRPKGDYLFGITLRSKIAAGKVQSITFPELSEDMTVVLPDDIPGKNRIQVFGSGMPVLAKEVRYRGEPIALIAGKEPAEIRRVLEGTAVEYDESDPVFYYEHYIPEQTVITREKIVGDPAGGMKKSSQSVEGEYRTGYQEHFYSEPNGAFAVWEGRGKKKKMKIYSSTQWAYHVKETAAEVCGFGNTDLSVEVTDIGVTLEGKSWYPSLIAAHAALLALKSGTNIKFILGREEDFLYSPKRNPVLIRHKTGLDPNGSLEAMEIDITVNTGAYPFFIEEIISRMMISAAGIYDCRNLRITGTAVSTNLPPLGGASGFGFPQAFFAIETHISRIAETVQSDPVEWRTANLLREGGKSVTGMKLTEDPLEGSILEKIARESDFKRKHAAFELQKKRRNSFNTLNREAGGIGIAFAFQGSGFHGTGEEQRNFSVKLQLTGDSKVKILTSAVSVNSVVSNLWKDIVVGILGILESDVEIVKTNTANVPDSGPSILSRNITILTRMVESCCNSIQRQRFRKALPLEVKRTYKLPRSVKWNEDSLSGVPFPQTAYCCTAVEVEVNPQTYIPLIKGIWIAINGGKIFNIAGAKETVESTIYSSFGWAMEERILFKQGAIPEDLAFTYFGNIARELPEPHIYFINPDQKGNPRGIGDLPFSCVPAAFTAAVAQATGRYLDRIPATPELIHSYTEES